MLELNTLTGREGCAVRRGCRADKYVATARFQWNNTTDPGFLVRWLSPGAWKAVALSTSDGKARIYKRTNDGVFATFAIGGTAPIRA